MDITIINDAFSRTAAPTLTWRDRGAAGRSVAPVKAVAPTYAVQHDAVTTATHNSMATKPAAPPRGEPR